ncbi:MAG: polysaccharide pyruvyl transferase family protein [Cystobacterineae bacterium]|nr:polysaccharide pyruvyl transferase family protein [Cystobacterineae bacterium]
MRIALLNDTAAEAHWGCNAVSDAHARMLGRAGHEVAERFFIGWNHGISKPWEPSSVDHLLRDDSFRQRIEGVDAVVLNGEGTLHHTNGLAWLAALGAAQRLGKITLLVNAVYQDSESHEDVIAKLDDFTVRDIYSLEYAKSRGLSARLVLDSSYAASFTNDKLADLSGKVVLTDWHPFRTSDVGETIKKRASEHHENVFFLPFARADAARTWSKGPATLSTAAVFHTARHHGVCFAIKAKVPFVALPSNTWKIDGFLKQYGPKIPVVTSFQDLKEAEAWAISNRDYYENLFLRVSEEMPLDTFRCLGVEEKDEMGEQREVERLAVDLSNYSKMSPLINQEQETQALSKRFIDMQIKSGDKLLSLCAPHTNKDNNPSLSDSVKMNEAAIQKRKKRLFISGGLFSLLNIFTLREQFPEDAEDVLLLPNEPGSELFFDSQLKLAEKGNFARIFPTNFQIDELRGHIDFEEIDEVYTTSNVRVYPEVRDKFRNAKYFFHEAGLTSYIKYYNDKSIKGAFFQLMHDKFGFINDNDIDIKKLDKDIFLKIASDMSCCYPIHIPFSKTDKVILFLSQYILFLGLGSERAASLYKESMRRLIDRGYKLIFKVHPRHALEIQALLRDTFPPSHLYFLDNILPSEIYDFDVVAVVSFSSGGLLTMSHLYDLPAFHIDFDADFNLELEKFFPRVIREYTPSFEILLGNAADKAKNECQKILCEVFNKFMSEKPLLSDNKKLKEGLDNIVDLAKHQLVKNQKAAITHRLTETEHRLAETAHRLAETEHRLAETEHCLNKTSAQLNVVLTSRSWYLTKPLRFLGRLLRRLLGRGNRKGDT